jgi:hypothetical protein
MINQDEKNLAQLREFLSELRADPVLTKQITELKNINFERSHLESQKSILESVSTLKEVKLLLKKVEKPDDFIEIFHSIVESETNITPKYSPIEELLKTI